MGERRRSSSQICSWSSYCHSDPSCEVEQDVDVVASLARRIERFADPLHPPLGVGHGAVRLAPRGAARQDDVGEFCGLGEIDVEHDEMIAARQQFDRLADVGLGLGGVLTDHEQRPELAPLHRLEHLGQVPPVLGRHRGSPLGFELGAGVVVLDVLESWQLVRQGAHVAAALHVVLAAQWRESGTESADLAGQDREVAQREHVVDAVVVLGDTERPAQLRGVGGGVRVGELTDGVGGYARDLLATLEGPLLDRGGVLLVAAGGALDERQVHETGVDDLPGDGVGERDVGADVEAQPPVGELRGLATARIDDVQLGAVVDRGQHVVEEDRVRVARVGAPHHDDVGDLGLLV